MPTTFTERVRGWFTVVLALAFAAALEIEYAVTSAKARLSAPDPQGR